MGIFPLPTKNLNTFASFIQTLTVSPPTTWIKIVIILARSPTTINYIMTGFVDDTTHWINQFEKALIGEYSQTEMYQDTQRTAQWWEQLLYATDGKLELNKCFYYAILWTFDEEGVPTLVHDIDDHITILSSDNGTHV